MCVMTSLNSPVKCCMLSKRTFLTTVGEGSNLEEEAERSLRMVTSFGVVCLSRDECEEWETQEHYERTGKRG